MGLAEVSEGVETPETTTRDASRSLAAAGRRWLLRCAVARPSGSCCKPQFQIPRSDRTPPPKNPPKKKGEITQHELLEELALRPLAAPPPQAPRRHAAAAGDGAAVAGIPVLLFVRLPHPPQQARRLPAAAAAVARP